jgi:hypothetical protein
MRSLLAAAVTTAALAGGVVAGTPAQAVAASPSQLTLSIEPRGGEASTVTLRCFPPGGTHPTPVLACADLAQAGGNPGLIKPTEGLCPAVILPVTASATGWWHGRRVAWTETYQNACKLRLATGDVFRF